MKTAKRSDWRNDPIRKPAALPYQAVFNDAEFRKVKQGFLPHQMEDKWFVFFEDDCLYFHRSWTGGGIYKLRIVRQDGNENYVVRECWVERDQEVYTNTDDTQDIGTLQRLIKYLLLENVSA
jgi:hypothetical protein